MDETKLLLVKGRAGFGNRMLAALTGILYARLSGRRLIVDWSDRTYSPNGSNVFDDFFECELCSPGQEIPETDSVSPSVWRGHLRETAIAVERRYGDRNDRNAWQRFSIDLRRLDQPEDVLVFWVRTSKIDLLRGHFKGAFEPLSGMSGDDILRTLLRDDLILHPRLRERVDRFKREALRGRTVGVHVRYADHRVRLWAILRELSALLRREPELQVFLATDNVHVKELVERLYPDVVTTPHWYSHPGRPAHFHQSRPDPIENDPEALVDLYLLAECDYLVVDTSSSFARVATLLTSAPADRVVNVKRRDKLTPRLRKLSWRLMLGLGLYGWGVKALGEVLKLENALRRGLGRRRGTSG